MLLKIKELRMTAGLSQIQLAEKLGVAQGSVSMWESEVSLPKTRQLLPLASALGVKVGDLFSEDTDELRRACS